MRYLLVVGGVLALQAVFSYIIIAANSGNGSFVGLGVMLFAALGIPLTALVNAITVRSRNEISYVSYLSRVIGASMLLPAAQLVLMVLASVLRW